VDAAKRGVLGRLGGFMKRYIEPCCVVGRLMMEKVVEKES